MIGITPATFNAQSQLFVPEKISIEKKPKQTNFTPAAWDKILWE